MKVKMLKQTNYNSQALMPDDGAEIDDQVARRWIDRKICVDAAGAIIAKEPEVKKIEPVLSESKPADKIHQTPTDATEALKKVNLELLNKISEEQVREIGHLQKLKSYKILTLEALKTKLLTTKGLNEQIKSFLAGDKPVEVEDDPNDSGS